MSQKERIEADLKTAMLQKDVLTRDTLRMVKAELMNREVEVGRDLTDDDTTAVLLRAVKSRRDSIEEYEKGGRTAAADSERAEIEVIERYLPRKLSEDETRAAIAAVVGELGLAGKKDLGQLMKELKARHGATMDMKVASRLAGALLEG
jgi:hypothetical protein